jgi:hypothetical protein
MPGELTKRIQANSNFNKFAEAGNGKIVASHDQESKGPITNEFISHTYLLTLIQISKFESSNPGLTIQTTQAANGT